MKILVLGDAFLDRYWVAEISGISAEAPIPVCKVQETFDLPGGALNVRRNLISLGADGRYLFPPLERKPNFPIKNRLISGQTQLARWDENDFCVPYLREDLLVLIEEPWDAIVVSDYGKGSVSKEVIQILRDLTIPVFVDTKQNPIEWLGSDALLFPNLSEYKQFQQIYEWFPRVILKQGKEGISLVEFGQVTLTRPSVATHVVSVNGAGDTTLAAFVVSALTGAGLIYCLEWSMAAAACAVESPYTSSPTWGEVDDKRNEGFV